MDEHPGDQIHATVGEQAQNVAVGKTITQVNLSITTPNGAERATDATRTAYLNWLIDRNRYLDSRGTQQTTRQVQLKLDEVYISLCAQVEASPNQVDRRLLEEEAALLEKELAGLPADEQEDRRDQLYARLGLQSQQSITSTTPIDLDEAVARYSQLVILGDPGSGKTTLLRYLALQHALMLVDERQQRPANDSKRLLPHFPILVRIAEYAEDRVWKGQALSDFLPALFARLECKPKGLADLLQQELAQGGCLVLLDGLDEIVDADDRRGIVQRIEDFIRAYAQRSQRGENRFIVTSRIAGYRNAPLTGSGSTLLPHYIVQEMDDSQIQRFLGRWCRAVEDFQTPDLAEAAQQATAQREIDGILEAVAKNPGVRRLAGNPLMLRVLALIHRTGARLPQKRIELYRLAADTLARTWRPAQGVPESALIEDRYLTPLLSKLAYWLHKEKPSGIATEREVYEVLGAEWARIRRLDIEEQWEEIQGEVDKFLKAVREHTGLFVERAPKRYGFMHLTFEEYYAARHLVARSKNRAQLIRQHLHDSRWEEPILLALGFVGLEYPDDAAELVETAILAQGAEAAALGFRPSEYETLLGRDYLFAVRCLGDEIPVDRRLVRTLLQRLSNELLYRSGQAIFIYYRQLLTIQLEQLHNGAPVKELVRLLLPAIEDANNEVRHRAVASLGHLRSTSKTVVAGLLTALRDEDEDVRLRAAVSLGDLGQATETVVTGLFTALCDVSGDVRYWVAVSLGQLGNRSSAVVTGLLLRLHDANWDIRYWAAAGLGQLSCASEAVVNGLLAALRDRNGNVRSQVVASLGQLGYASEPVVRGLLAALRDKNGNVRSRAATSLGQLGYASTLVITGLLTSLRDEDKEVRYRTVMSLGHLGHNSHLVTSHLLAALHDINSSVRSQAAISLGLLGDDSDAVVACLLMTLRDKDENVRYKSAASLIQLGQNSKTVIAGFLAALRNKNEYIRYEAAASLAQLGHNSDALVAGLQAALYDTNGNVWHQAAVSLTQLGHSSEAILNILVTIIIQGESNSLRRNAAKLVGQRISNAEQAEPFLLRGLLDDDHDVRTACSTALVQLAKRFPARKIAIAKQLAQAIHDPAFTKEDKYTKRTSQDYAHEALWQVVAG